MCFFGEQPSPSVKRIQEIPSTKVPSTSKQTNLKLSIYFYFIKKLPDWRFLLAPPGSKLIITLEDRNHIDMLKEKLTETKNFSLI
jgi:hypothetical protein